MNWQDSPQYHGLTPNGLVSNPLPFRQLVHWIPAKAKYLKVDDSELQDAHSQGMPLLHYLQARAWQLRPTHQHVMDAWNSGERNFSPMSKDSWQQRSMWEHRIKNNPTQIPTYGPLTHPAISTPPANDRPPMDVYDPNRTAFSRRLSNWEQRYAADRTTPLLIL